MIASIISAGEGSRLLEEGAKVHKPLIKINGEPMLGRLINILQNFGFDCFKIIVNQQSDDVANYISNLKKDNGLNLELIQKSTPSSLHSLYELNSLIKGKPFHLFTVDTIFKPNEFNSYIDFCSQHNEYDAIIAITSFIDDEKPLYVELKNDMIIKFADVKDNCTSVTAGFYYFNIDISNLLDKAINSGTFRLRNFLRLLNQEGLKVAYYNFSKVIDIDHIKDIETAEQFLNEK